ncbi:hypothetical protein [Thauera sp. SDU_THAU2]|uniref:hypothetical protein n=1 Tax=Thauera sp. SDU_THAU2 TaxID=3136633 RepID=UPI00311F0807
MPSRITRALLHLALLLTAVCIFVPLLPTLAQDGLDESWMFGMNTALAQGLVPGRDIVFTLGPYAAIYTRAYHPATDAGMVWGSLFLALSFAFVLQRLCRQAGWPRLLLVLAVFAGIAYSRDALLLFVPLLAGAYAYGLARRGTHDSLRTPATLAALALAYAPFGLLVLVKGSMLVGCVVTQLLGVALFLVRRQAPAALTILLAPLSGALLFWSLAGLPLGALPDYFSTIFPIISGYTEAMATSGPLAEVLLYLFVIAALTTCLTIGEKEHGLAAVYFVLVFAASAFLAFKGGFVRHDGHVGHALLAACHLVLAALLVHLLRPSRATLALVFVSLLAWLGSSVHHAIPRAGFALIPPTFVMPDRLLLQKQLEAGEWTAAARLSLSAGARHFVSSVRNNYGEAARGLAIRLGNGASLDERHAERIAAIAARASLPQLPGSTDIYSFRQTRLIATGNQWNPRPVFQSYTVYTPALAELNRRHLVAEHAPDNILLRLEPIDGRLPALEDGPSWPALLSHYAPAGFDNGYLLLKKAPPAATVTVTALPAQRGRLGQRIELPGGSTPLLARVHTRPSLIGKLAALFYKPTPLHITLELQNGSTRDYRFVSSMAQAGFLLSPFIGSAADFARLYDGARLPAGLAVTAVTVHGDTRLWQEDFDIELTPLALPAAASITPRLPGLAVPQPVPLPLREAAHCDGSIARINGTRSHDAQIVEGLLHTTGWSARSIQSGEAAHGIQLILTDTAGRHLRLQTQPDPRPDLATYFEQPQLADSGYVVAADLRGLSGEYTLRVAHEHEGEIRLCPSPVIPLRLSDTSR